MAAVQARRPAPDARRRPPSEATTGEPARPPAPRSRAMGNTHTVRFEPVGIEIEVDEDETILNAAFRQGIMLMHGCKEGQCSACKSFLLDGEVDLDRYSTFALPDFEEAEGWTLLCRAHPYSDLEIELINYDEEIIRSGMPTATVARAGRGGRRAHLATSGSCALRPDGAARVQARPVRRHHDPRRRGGAPLVLDGEHAGAGRARVHDQALPGRALLGPARRRLDQARRRAGGHRALRRLHAARQLPAAAAVHRRRRRDGADPVAAALAAETGLERDGDLLLRRAHRGRPVPPRRARRRCPLQLRPRAVGGRATAGPARPG